ncbi:hypothetical protein ACTXIT_11335 [Corynebacterium casei]|uniref:hypothetical protein n=1 Tax=Actinomycetes TaxID=1760 RepID=UPI0026489B1B|nr:MULTISPECIES: hypothetical protein [Actinomycetes]MDN6130456.1 hypothetical protein [Corynebacterium casei]MDN6154696.1 hypothetical protein [Corynebacterium casei]MDN6456707.1 hypothetical protein [Yaniella sp.]MDN6678140.1 hypothetical protein [Yaniella sp.]MDN6737487.1 hypothetical protein [Corynebacterium sp.]
MIDTTAAYTHILASMPGQNLTPQAPGDFGEKIDRGLNFGLYIGIAVAIIGVMVVGASMVISRREGTSEEATSNAIRIGIGCLILGSASTVVMALL